MYKAAVSFHICCLFLLAACSDVPRSVPFPVTEAAAIERIDDRIPWSPPIKYEWQILDRGILNSSHDSTIDLKNLKRGKLDVGGFIPLAEPMKNIPLDYNFLHDTSIDLASLPTQKLQYKTCLLGEPTKIKTGVPRIRDDASDAILFFSQDQGIHPGTVSNCMA
jgi:hypothetical protein